MARSGEGAGGRRNGDRPTASSRANRAREAAALAEQSDGAGAGADSDLLERADGAAEQNTATPAAEADETLGGDADARAAQIEAAVKAIVDEMDFDDEMFDMNSVEDEPQVEEDGKKFRELISGGPQRPDTAGMSREMAENALREWRKQRKKYTDKMRKTAIKLKQKRHNEDDEADLQAYTGDCTPVLRRMCDVAKNSLRVGNTFNSKEVLQMRVAEEANLRNLVPKTVHSSVKEYEVVALRFHVRAVFSIRTGWKVTQADLAGDQVLAADLLLANPGEYQVDEDELDEENLPDKDGGGNDANADGDDEQGADGQNDEGGAVQQQAGCVKKKRPVPLCAFKSVWLVPLIRDKIALAPGTSTKELRHELSPYVLPTKLSSTLIQSAKCAARIEVFGTPEENVQFARKVVEELKELGHQVELQTASYEEFHKHIMEKSLPAAVKVEKARVKDLIQRKRPEDNFPTTRAGWNVWWKNWNSAWLKKNLRDLLGTDTSVEFLTGIKVTMNWSREQVPKLLNIYAADAAHVNFGKFTLFSCYGHSSNNNAVCVAFALLFGNEDTANWKLFWNFVQRMHPSIDRSCVTIVTDQDKGVIPAMAHELQDAFNFHCGRHRAQNITKRTSKKGISGTSATQEFERLVNAITPEMLERRKRSAESVLSATDWSVVNELPDTVQYPAARCAMGNDVYMYSRSTSATVESMNRANLPARQRAAVDMVNAAVLLIRLETDRFLRLQRSAHVRTHPLTPVGQELMESIRDGCDPNDFVVRWYSQAIQNGNHHVLSVKKNGSQRQRTVRILKAPSRQGSLFCDCTCCGSKVTGLPCEHMVAAIKANIIPNIRLVDIMPYWYYTSQWKKQYPQIDVQVFESVANVKGPDSVRDTTLRCAPAAAVAAKKGRPKSGKRIIGAIEQGANKRPRKKMKCSSCGMLGHRVTECRMAHEENYPDQANANDN